MTSSAFMYSGDDSTAKKADSLPNILLRIDYEWPLIFLSDIWAIYIQERLSPSSRVTNFTCARVKSSLHYPWGKWETTCNLVEECCVTSQKEVSIGENTAWYKLNFFIFCVGWAVLYFLRNSLLACISLGVEKSGFLSIYNMYFHCLVVQFHWP